MNNADFATPFTVTQIATILRETLEETFSRVSVGGEISNLTKAGSGHYYFTLKDETSQLACTCWSRTASKLAFKPAAGMQIVATGRVTFYGPNGKCQLSVDAMQPVGVGAAEIAKRQLIEKLRGLGWFDEARKKPLPAFPRRVALVTSATGAAVRDMIQSFARRWPLAELIVRHSRVQGEAASAEIAAAIRELDALHAAGHLRLDAVIVGRGGGSAEDLNAFNAEIVAAAIFACRVPVVAAVGHEIDVTIADLVADLRAETPSNAVTLLTPDRDELLADLVAMKARLGESLRGKVANARRRVDSIASRPAFERPFDRIRRGEQKLDDLAERLRKSMRRRIEKNQQRVGTFAERLESVSPLNVLQRGYSVTKTTAGPVVRSVRDVKAGEVIRTIIGDGEIESAVTAIHKKTA